MKKILSVLCSILIIIQISTVSMADDINDKKEIIYIKNEKDLISFSRDCILDSYSENLIVYLENDITLTSSFSPIPTFSGEFDGQNHKISSFDLATDGSHQGFFRYIQQKGIVKNLKIEGTVKPESSMCKVGGIVGVNYGTIDNCEFNGIVSGLNYIGGIAGLNHGTIKNCISYGTVQGKRFTGGISGLNEFNSEILSCINNANVNTEISEGGLDIDKINISNALDSLNLVSVQDKDVVADSGGITGNNLGFLHSCINEGKIGYPHYGYNVGGISGRQSGYLNECENNGPVFGRNDVGGIVGQMEPFLILKERTTITEAITSLTNSTNYALKRLRENSSEYTGEIEAATSSLQNAYVTAQQYQEETDPQIKEEYLEEMKTELQYSLTALNEVAPKLQDTVNYATTDFQSVNASTYTVLNLLAAALNGNSVTKIYSDTSSVTDEENVNGRVSNCVNNATVQGDKYIGGISGNASIELDFDMEGTMTELFQDQIETGIESSNYESKTVCLNNINNGEVNSKKDYCGGIIGYQDIGIVYNCDNYANVTSLQSFCGGIVGRSNSIIQKCHAMCEIDGNEYVGGIAGYGINISNCATLVKMQDATAAFGAIAGYAINFNEENFGGNIFVSDELGAIDGISYDGLAKAEPFDKFVLDENIPSRMKQLTVTFKADDTIVKVIPFEYGGRIQKSMIPKVPDKNGYTGAWEEFKNDNLRFNQVVNAVYTSRIGAVASQETRKDLIQPIVVAEGNFDTSTNMQLVPYSIVNFPKTDGNDSFIESYAININDGKNEKEISIRYLPPEINEKMYSYRIFVLDSNNEWKEVATNKIGSYLEFKTDSNIVTFCVYSHKSDTGIFLYLIATLLVLVVCIIIYKRNNKSNKSDDSKNPDTIVQAESDELINLSLKDDSSSVKQTETFDIDDM